MIGSDSGDKVWDEDGVETNFIDEGAEEWRIKVDEGEEGNT